MVDDLDGLFKDLKEEDKKIKREEQKKARAEAEAEKLLAASDAFHYQYTEVGVARKIHDIYPDTWFYVVDGNSWYHWTGRHWKLDETMQIAELVKSVAVNLLLDSVHGGNKEAKEYYLKCCDSTKMKHIIECAKSLYAIPPGKIDSATELFPTENGVYNLNTHEFTNKHDRELYLTKISPISYNESVKCPKWLAHLRLVFEGDPDLISTFQEVCGYSLLSDNPSQNFIILYGGGNNGKSVTANVVRSILGTFSRVAQVETIMRSRGSRDGSGHRSDLMHLIGSRMVMVSEGNPTDELASGLIKQMTHGDEMTARGAYERRGREFRPGWKLWFVTNHLPTIDGADYALARGMIVFPFLADIKAEDRVLDYDKILLDEEGAGILNWMIEGLKRYQERGRFDLPETIKKEIERYKTSNDVLLQWMNESCVKGPDEMDSRVSLYGRDTKEPVDDLSFRSWCRKNGYKPMGAKTFWNLLSQRGVHGEHKDGRTIYINTERGVKGLRLMTSGELKNVVDPQQKVTADTAE